MRLLSTYAVLVRASQKFLSQTVMRLLQIGGFYSSSNIRFAASLIKQLRFQASRAPGIDRTVHTVEDGHCVCHIHNAFGPFLLICSNSSIGESGGASLVLGHLNSYGGGSGPLPLKQAITQNLLGFANAAEFGDQNLHAFWKTQMPLPSKPHGLCRQSGFA